ncbi:Hypothetical_protein [Hexamita inflata]|uniref:Hypothetical_protein n=1 Tax=Hexamita inflata TaxID=28002 RepID=A0AA86TG64_9EUKA|nr:Hypothetical protein HINF_LOCUS2942 [Hexamita inflata]
MINSHRFKIEYFVIAKSLFNIIFFIIESINHFIIYPVISVNLAIQCFNQVINASHRKLRLNGLFSYHAFLQQDQNTIAVKITNEVQEKKEELQKQVQKQIEQLTEATKQIETKNKELDTVKAEQKAEVEKIQQQHAEEKEALEAQLEQIQIQHSQTENKSTELIKENKKAVEYTKSLENKIVDTQNENVEVKANLKQVQIENKAVYEQNKNLQECVDQLISKNQQQQAELEEQTAKFTQQVTAVEDELKTTRTQLKLVQAMGRKYDSGQQQQQEIIQQQKASIAKLEEELLSAQKLNQEQQQKLLNLEHTEQELAAFKEKNQELTECVESLTQKIDKLQQKLSNNTTELKLAELQTLYKNQYKELSAVKIDLERVTQEKASLVIQTKQLQFNLSQLQYLNNMLKQKQQESESVQASLKQIVKQKALLEEQYSAMCKKMVQNQNLLQTLLSSSENQSQLTKQIQQLEHHAQQQNTQLDAQQKTINELKQRVALQNHAQMKNLTSISNDALSLTSSISSQNKRIFDKINTLTQKIQFSNLENGSVANREQTLERIRTKRALTQAQNEITALKHELQIKTNLTEELNQVIIKQMSKQKQKGDQTPRETEGTDQIKIMYKKISTDYEELQNENSALRQDIGILNEEKFELQNKIHTLTLKIQILAEKVKLLTANQSLKTGRVNLGFLFSIVLKIYILLHYIVSRQFSFFNFWTHFINRK